MISGALHALVALVLAGIIYAAHVEQEDPPIQPAVMEPLPQPEKEPPPERELDPEDVEIVSDEITDTPVVVDIEVPVEKSKPKTNVLKSSSQKAVKKPMLPLSKAVLLPLTQWVLAVVLLVPLVTWAVVKARSGPSRR